MIRARQLVVAPPAPSLSTLSKPVEPDQEQHHEDQRGQGLEEYESRQREHGCCSEKSQNMPKGSGIAAIFFPVG